ncbi:hypothetical protein PIB30_019471 [Stylosanthes scabra]|uniref:Uncharacterized protein n=1 Tax=Stylosanthes scabra TaxID=79078 RepID=A0ABU6T9F7_9FABA|nr:hypothetical protein [Stylosanthes scabra]
MSLFHTLCLPLPLAAHRPHSSCRHLSSLPSDAVRRLHPHTLTLKLSPSLRSRQSLVVAASRESPLPQAQNVYSSLTAPTTPSCVQSLAVAFRRRSPSRAAIEEKKLRILQYLWKLRAVGS